MYQILIAVDGSEHARHAIEAVARQPHKPDAMAVVLVNVSNPIYYGELSPVSLDDVESARRLVQERLLDTAAQFARAQGLTINACHSATGHIASEIVAVARDIGANQIAMGTRGMGAVGNLIMGSVALGVVHLSQVPVLLVR